MFWIIKEFYPCSGICLLSHPGCKYFYSGAKLFKKMKRIKLLKGDITKIDVDVILRRLTTAIANELPTMPPRQMNGNRSSPVINWARLKNSSYGCDVVTFCWSSSACVLNWHGCRSCHQAVEPWASSAADAAAGELTYSSSVEFVNDSRSELFRDIDIFSRDENTASISINIWQVPPLLLLRQLVALLILHC